MVLALIQIVCSFIDGLLQLLFLQLFIQMKLTFKGKEAVFIFITTLISIFMDMFVELYFLKSILIIFAGIIYCLSIKRNLGISLFLPSFFMAQIYVTELVVLGIATILFGSNLSTLIQEEPFQIFCTIISQGILFFFTGILLFIIQKNKANPEHISRTYWIMLCSGIIIFGSVVALISYSLTLKPSMIEKMVPVLAVVFTLITVLFVVLSLNIAKETENKFRFQSELAAKEMQLKEQDQIQLMYNKMLGLQHDFKNHLQVVGALAQNNAELNKYIGNLSGSVNTIDVHTGNGAVDAIIESKVLLANNHGLTVHVETVCPETYKIATADLCAVIFNMLDNAIEACIKNNAEDHKWISFVIKQKKGFLLIKCENPYEEEPQRNKYGFKTSKKTGIHGIGIKQIKAIADNYNGIFDFAAEKGRFYAKILISNPVDSHLTYVSNFHARPSGMEA